MAIVDIGIDCNTTLPGPVTTVLKNPSPPKRIFLTPCTVLISIEQDSDIAANQIRFEKYELKGFNSMTPNIQKEKLELKLVKIHKLINGENIDDNISEFNISEEDIKLIKESKYGRMKFKECTFDDIILGNLQLNKFGNY